MTMDENAVNWEKVGKVGGMKSRNLLVRKKVRFLIFPNELHFHPLSNFLTFNFFVHALSNIS